MLDREQLRALVREALQDALPSLGQGGPRPVSIRDDAELAAFVADVVRLADDPRDGPRLRAGEIRFRLVHAPAPAVPRPAVDTAPEHRVERGAVTERHVRAAESAGARLVVGPRAVLTPMARDRARSAGVEVVREPGTGGQADGRRHG